MTSTKKGDSSTNKSISPTHNNYTYIKWPHTKAAKLLPAPKNLYGRIEANTKKYFYAEVQATKDEFKEYTTKCEALSFNNGKGIKNSNSFHNLDANWNSLYIYFSETNQEMSIKLEMYERL